MMARLSRAAQIARDVPRPRGLHILRLEGVQFLASARDDTRERFGSIIEAQE